MPGPVFIEGDQVTLRTIEEEDLSFLQRGVNDPDVWRWVDQYRPVNAEQEREFFEEVVSEEGSVQLLVCVDGDPVGTAGLNFDHEAVTAAELGYWIDPDHHGNGYGSDAAAALVEYGFNERGCHRISARVFGHNEASQGLLESLGFTREGRQREARFSGGEYRDLLWYGLLAEEWD